MTSKIDLRSDTVTKPTALMREVMLTAPVGDDVYGEDPSVLALEDQVSDLLGMSSALFVSSGTQSNLLALLTHCARGDEYIAGQSAHTYQFEAGGAAVLGGIQPQPIAFEEDGSLSLSKVAAHIKPDDFHFAKTQLLCLENTQGGKVLSLEYLSDAAQMCADQQLKLHMDGARLFNAVTDLKCSAVDIAKHCDSVSICLSKGLGAPVGSVLVGDSQFIRTARRWRKMLGGGMRQAGLLAAAGSYALSNHIARLQEDHLRAQHLGEAVNQRFPGIATVHTNMVILALSQNQLTSAITQFAAHDVVIRNNRWVLHLDIDDAAQQRVLDAVSDWQLGK